MSILSEKTMDLIRHRIDASITQNFKEEGRPDKWKKSIRAKATGGKTLSDTGTLKNSIVVDIGKRQQIIAGTGTVYAAVHQFGINKTVNVKAHTRKIKQAFGRPINPTTVNVKAHTMKMNIPARPFLMVQDNDWEYIAEIILQGVENAFGK